MSGALCGMDSKTVGFVLWGENVKRGAWFEGDGTLRWHGEEARVFSTVEALLRAVIQAAHKRGAKGAVDTGDVYGPVTIKKVTEATYTETKRSYEAV